MKKDPVLLIFSVFLSLLWLLAACAPQATPTLSPAIASAPKAPTVSPATLQPAPEDAAWAKVVKAAKQEGKLTIYSVAFVGDVGRRVSEDFKNQTGISAEILVGSGATLLEKIKVEQAMKHGVGDIWNSRSAGSIAELVLLGGADSIAQELPALRDKSVFKVDPVYSPGGEALVWAMGYGDSAINTKLLKPGEEPRSYKDLLTPAWKGKILSMEPRGSGGTIFYHSLRYHKALDLDFYQQLAQQDMKIWGGSANEATLMVARGEFPIILATSNDIVAPMIAEGAPLKMLTPDEGNTGSLGGVVVIKGGPHPNASRVFVNWLLSPEGQRSYAGAASTNNIRKDVPDFLAPGAQMTPKKIWARSWDMEEWARKEIAAKTMDKIFGSK